MPIIKIIGIIKGCDNLKFIYCFTQELKEQLLKTGYKILLENNNIIIFENSSNLSFNFNEIDNKQFIFSNKMIF